MKNNKLIHELSWIDVVGFEGLYKVSECGCVLSLRGNHKILKTTDSI